MGFGLVDIVLHLFRLAVRIKPRKKPSTSRSKGGRRSPFPRVRTKADCYHPLGGPIGLEGGVVDGGRGPFLEKSRDGPLSPPRFLLALACF